MVKLKVSLSILLLCFLAQAQQWRNSELIGPARLAAELKTPDPSRHVLYVGFPILYKGAHIASAHFAGPCSKQEGLDLLNQETKDLPHDAEVVIYCGCCPFVKCPNIHPAYQALKDKGFTNIKVLQLETNLHTDWVEKGYPVEGK